MSASWLTPQRYAHGVVLHVTHISLMRLTPQRHAHGVTLDYMSCTSLMRLTPKRNEHGMTLHDTREPHATYGAATRARRDASRHTQASRGSRRSAMTTAAFAILSLARAPLTGRDVAARCVLPSAV